MSATQSQVRATLGKNAWPPLAVAVAAIGLAIAALASGGGNNGILERAAHATAEQDSYRFEFDQSAGARGQRVAGMHMEGFFDKKSGLSRLNLGFGGQAGSNACTVIADKDAWYVQIPEDRRIASGGKEWIKTNPLASPQGLVSTPSRGESLVDLNAVGDLKEVGRERVRGVNTTHYRGSFDFASTFENSQTNPLVQDQLRRLKIPDRIPVEFWIDNDDLIRRTSYAFEIPSGPVRVQTELRYEAYDFGIKEEVAIPAPDEIAAAPQVPGFAACLTPTSPINR